MDHNRAYHKHISDYLDTQKRDFLTESFGYSTYTAPNTMFNLSNDMPEIMISMPPTTLKVWLRILSLLKRNHDPVLACTAYLEYDAFTDVAARTSFYKARKKLASMGLIIKTTKRSMYIVNVKYANKLFKPKLEL